MKLFVQKGYHLSSLSPAARAIYTIFLAFIGLGLWTSWDLYAARIGGDLEGPAGRPSVQERYVERAPAAPAAALAGDEGPALDLPDEGPDLELPVAPDALGEAEPASIKGPWIMDVFHQHAFSVSVVFLILAHLFMLTRLHQALTLAVVLLAGVSSLLHVLAPVIIWKTGGGLWLMPASGAAMGISWTLMVAWTFVAMWFVRPPRRAAGRPEA